jgi:2,3-dihydroxybiphenyl 1,2-dioxygenase
MTQIQALSYVVVRAKDLDEWSAYGTRLVGLQRADKTRSTLAFRMDDRKQRVIVNADGGQGIEAFGWEVADHDALATLATRVQQAKVDVAYGSRSLAEQRQVQELLVVHDPLGNRLEISCGASVAADPFVAGRTLSGFRTGPLGMGHVVLTVERIDEALGFYRDALGFGLSDYYHQPFEAYFFHVNARHHSFALIQSGTRSIHHMMVEHFDLDDVGQALDIAASEEGRIGVTLGRHCGDYMTSFYSRSPSGFMIEHGWGGRLIDPKTWIASIRSEGPSLWGHERAQLAPEARQKAREMRMANAVSGLRRPVQVIEGNYELMPGTCSSRKTSREKPS